MKSENNKVHNFFRTFLITLIVTRIWIVSLFWMFHPDSAFMQRIIHDSFHHYHVGILFVLLSFLLRKRSRAYILLAIGLGIILEELMVVLGDLGFNTNKFYYTGYDFIFVLLLTFMLYFVVLKLEKDVN